METLDTMETLSTCSTFALLGDVHGKDRIVIDAIEKVSNYTNLIVQVGDFHCYSKKTVKLISHHAQRNNVSIVFIPGNHENWDYLDDLSVDKLSSLTGSLIYAPRGSQGKIGAKNALFFGGAYSIDRYWRDDDSWFAQEVIDDKQAHDFVDKLGNSDDSVHMMFTHDVPSSLSLPQECFLPGKLPEVVEQEALAHRKSLSIVYDFIQPEFLAHGHYHHGYRRTHLFYHYNCITQGVGQERDNGSLLIVNNADNAYKVASIDLSEK